MIPFARGRQWALLAAMIGCVVPTVARGQDSQYWTIAYGTEGLLLGGVVIGSAVDISSTYYDPGSFALGKSNGLAVAGSAYQLSTVKYTNGIGPKKDLTTSSVLGVPTLFAGQIKLKGHDRLAYSFLTRQRLDLQIQGRNLPLDSSITATHLAFSSASAILNQHYEEYWGGLTYAHPFNEHIGVGITPYVAIRSQTASFEGLAAALGASGAAGVAFKEADFNYTNWGLLAKVGLGIVYPDFSAGLTLTTPRAKLFGSGAVGRTLTLVNQGVAGTGATSPTIAIDYQENLASSVNSPVAVGAGGSYTWGVAHTATTVYGSLEWYGSVSEYSILSPAPLTPATGGAPLTSTVKQDLNAVTNWGLALKHGFGAAISGYTSFRTDFSALGPQSENNANVARWNLLHVTGGASFALGGSQFVLGADIAFGSFTQAESIGLATASVPIVPGGAKVGYTATTLIVGFRTGGP